MARLRIEVPADRVREFCRKWRVKEFSVFGSALRDDFGPHSDVDILVEFAQDAPWDLWHLAEMHDELRTIFGRDIDLVEKRALRNPFRKHTILSTHEVIHVS